MITLRMDQLTAESALEALRVVLDNLEVHSDEAEILEFLANRLECLIEDWRDRASDFDANY